MKIQIIVNGSTKWQRFIKRWGLAILIGEDILFDTFGEPKFFINQIKKKQIEINKLKHIVLSHEHWDHITGLWPILEINPQVTVYLGKHFSADFKKKIQATKATMVEIDKSVQIKENIFTTPEFYSFYNGAPLYESSLVIKTLKGLILLTGCAHPGLEKMIDSVLKQFNQNIYMLIGGFHLNESYDYEIKKVIQYLHQKGVQKIMPLHCTGKLAEQLMSRSFEDNFINGGINNAVCT